MAERGNLMRISMWMLYERLKVFKPEANIQSADLRIEALQALTNEAEIDENPSIAYIWFEDAGRDRYASSATVRLRNGEDEILLRQVENTSLVINALLKAIKYFEAWYRHLEEAIERRSVCGIFELAGEILGNPILIVDEQGKAVDIGDSSADVFAESPDVESLTVSQLSGSASLFCNGAPAWVTDRSSVYTASDGRHVLARFIEMDQGSAWKVTAWETGRAFLPSDARLLDLICDAACDMLNHGKASEALYTASDVLRDLTLGIQVDEIQLHMLRDRYPPPWRLLLFRISSSADKQQGEAGSYLVSKMRSSAYRCIPYLAEGHAVAAVFEADVERLLNELGYSRERPHFSVCVSQPFDDFHLFGTHYAQCCFLIPYADEEPGIYCAENYGMAITLDDLLKRPFNMQHPALNVLRRYDAERKGDLYNTLYQYLINERSTLRTSQALGIHKNSVLFRLNQISELTSVNLEDPMTRTYLILSYMLDKPNC